MNYAGYSYNKDHLTELFSVKSKKAKYTVKALRNMVTHGLSNAAIKEINNRKEELFGYMDEFLNIIRTSDQEDN